MLKGFSANISRLQSRCEGFVWVAQVAMCTVSNTRSRHAYLQHIDARAPTRFEGHKIQCYWRMVPRAVCFISFQLCSLWCLQELEVFSLLYWESNQPLSWTKPIHSRLKVCFRNNLIAPLMVFILSWNFPAIRCSLNRRDERNESWLKLIILDDYRHLFTNWQQSIWLLRACLSHCYA